MTPQKKGYLQNGVGMRPWIGKVSVLAALSVLATTVCESQKVEGLRLAQPALLPLRHCVSPKGNQPRLSRM
jgi:hypothetical protein